MFLGLLEKISSYYDYSGHFGGVYMDRYIIKKKDSNENFFHFTSERNLNTISLDGLIPNIGSHAKYLEKSKKIFFVEGLDNLLILFDCWINVYYYMPTIPFIYTIGAHFLRQKWFPKVIADGYFGTLKRVKLHQKKAFKVFDKLLDSSILLKLDLKENVDFKYDDIDEIKIRGYKKRHLELMGYSKKYSNLNSTIMDKWNLHTITGHKIASKNIKLCTLDNGNYKLREIFNYCVENTKIDLEYTCPALYAYLSNNKIRKKL